MRLRICEPPSDRQWRHTRAELARTQARRCPTQLPACSSPDTAQMFAGCELYFPAARHTGDNILAWPPRRHVLFSGWLPKSVTSAALGNLADSVVPDWCRSAERVGDRYPGRKLTIPGTRHGCARCACSRAAGCPTRFTRENRQWPSLVCSCAERSTSRPPGPGRARPCRRSGWRGPGRD
jgi:hypothetical protein